MFLSFIVPVYNVEKYVGECLDSLLNQDISHEDYEIICVNDGSTDGSLEILRKYQAANTNIHVIDKTNGGVTSARNSGFDAARGDYIWFFDSDDICLPNCLPDIHRQIRETNCDRLQIGTYVFGERLTDAEKTAMEDHSLKVNSHFYDSIVCNSILRRAFLIEHNCYFHYPEITHGEDSLYMTECVQHLPVTHIFDEPVYLYRTRAGSAQHTVCAERKEKQLRSYLQIAIIMKEHYERGTKTPTQTANALMEFIWITLFGCINAPVELGREVMSEMKSCGLYPFIRPRECTIRKSYQTTRTDIVGRIFDKIYIHLHRPWGYAAMTWYHQIYSLIKNRGD